MSFCRRIAVLAAAGLALTAAAFGQDATCDTLITTAPYTISTPGHYCLANAIATTITSGAAITIDANSVVLDLKGYRFAGGSVGVGTGAYGIDVLNRNYVVIRNGDVRGFLAGIAFEGNGSGTTNRNNVIENTTLDGNTGYGIVVGLGQNNVVRNCIITNTGGSTVAGITTGFGLNLGSNTSFAINNLVVATTVTSGGTSSIGIAMASDSRAVDNQVIGDGNTGNSTNYCMSFGPGTIYRDNVVSKCGTNYIGGTAVGTTNYP
jgi:hypothetical protein